MFSLRTREVVYYIGVCTSARRLLSGVDFTILAIVYQSCRLIQMLLMTNERNSWFCDLTLADQHHELCKKRAETTMMSTFSQNSWNSLKILSWEVEIMVRATNLAKRLIKCLSDQKKKKILGVLFLTLSRCEVFYANLCPIKATDAFS